MNRHQIRDWSQGVASRLRSRVANAFRQHRKAAPILALLASILIAAPLTASPHPLVSQTPGLRPASTILGPAELSEAEQSIQRARAAEIRESEEAKRDRRFNDYLQLVMLPLGVCFILILLLRRGP